MADGTVPAGTTGTQGLAFQDQIRDNFCFGCGADNSEGLQIKSYWDDDGAVCSYEPKPHQAAGPRHILNGGIIATLLDCHAICTAMADAYRRDGREIGSAPELWFATKTLHVSFLRPTPLEGPVELHARVLRVDERETEVECTLSAGGKTCAEATVVAVSVPASWRHGSS